MSQFTFVLVYCETAIQNMYVYIIIHIYSGSECVLDMYMFDLIISSSLTAWTDTGSRQGQIHWNVFKYKYIGKYFKYFSFSGRA